MRPQTLVLIISIVMIRTLDAESAAIAPGVTLEVVQGDGAIHNVRGTSFVEPILRVSEAGRPVSGASVTFLVPQVGPGGRFADGPVLTVTTGEDGIATGRGLRPNNQAGQWDLRVSASYAGRLGRVTLTQINAAPIMTQTSRSHSRTYVVLGVIAGGAAAGLVAAVSGGASAAPAVVTPPATAAAVTKSPVIVTPGNGSFGGPQ